jgi:membrane glycosyltransferase
VTRKPAAARLCDHYLERISSASGVAVEVRPESGPREAMTRLHHALAGRDATPDNPARGSVAARLRLLEQACGEAKLLASPSELATLAPPVNRTSMVPHQWGTLNPFKRWMQSLLRRRHRWQPRKSKSADEGERQPWPARTIDEQIDDVVDSPDPRGRWQYNGNMRRIALLALMLAQTGAATWFMSLVLPYQGKTLPELATLVLFAILYCWVSSGFWTAMTGFLVLARGNDPFIISRRSAPDKPIDPSARTAIVMPICNEDVPRVFAGLRATYESLAKTGQLDRFDFFILSDSSESDVCVAEIAAWSALCRDVGGAGRIFYRRRRRRVKRKSGNIDDFCRRWGKNYRYMIVLDADSVMNGSCLTTLVQLMEANPGAGIIQTAPRAAGRETLYARIQQFSTRVYGPLFTAGLHYWQLGESHYWGHNAIIRVAPFIRHCALAPLPGRGSLAGEIMSHDFVEAALMRRAGWAVWIAYDLDGSYEEMPPNLLDELKRDRRWCHGNLMNFRLFPARGMHPVHRAVFVTGVMAYLSAPLWFLFLALSTGMLAMHTLIEPQYFTEPKQLFPHWPQWHPEKAIALLATTATLLFLPKIMSVLLVCVNGAQQFGGRLRLIASMLIELLFSMLLAPVRMMFHTHFVIASFLGWPIRWTSPPREDSQTTWGEATRKHGLHTLLGIAWALGVYKLNPSFLPWLMPIAGALALSIPISVLSSRVTLGRWFRKAKLFVIPEEAAPPAELSATFSRAAAMRNQPGFIDAVVDPFVNALVCAAGHARPRLPSTERAARDRLAHSALRSSPEELTETQKKIILDDPLLLSRLHFEVWSSEKANPVWRASVDHESRLPSVSDAVTTGDQHGAGKDVQQEFNGVLRRAPK